MAGHKQAWVNASLCSHVLEQYSVARQVLQVIEARWVQLGTKHGCSEGGGALRVLCGREGLLVLSAWGGGRMGAGGMHTNLWELQCAD